MVSGLLGLVLMAGTAFLVACSLEAGKDQEYTVAAFYAILAVPAGYGMGYFLGWWS
jgi:hypothetical protein